ncbi:MAG: recombinase family protein [Muribaculaceae bacterium]|nr:recombinase family protein [Muribaculaceae bacterium]
MKLKEEERKGLNRLKEEISKGGVSTVYAWEVSRIGRKKKVIFSIVDFLHERGIQLIIKEPSIRLLKENEEGKLDIDDGAETILALFAQMAESEMRNKQSRWQRTRRANSEKGKWNGGTKPMFGYNIGKDNFYVINEEEAQIVRILYELYTTTDMGQDRIRKEMLSRG